jgi:hypothetical protein
VLVTGGISTGGVILSSAELYDPVANNWMLLSSPIVDSRTGEPATVPFNSSAPNSSVVLSVGSSGSSGSPVVLADVEQFSLSSQAFTFVGALPTARKAHCAAAARAGHQAFLLPNNNNVLLVGGTYNGSTLASSELYTPWLTQFTATGSTSTPRSSATGAALFPLADGQLLVVGGSNQQTNPTGTVTTTVANTGELYAGSTAFTSTGLQGY